MTVDLLEAMGLLEQLVDGRSLVGGHLQPSGLEELGEASGTGTASFGVRIPLAVVEFAGLCIDQRGQGMRGEAVLVRAGDQELSVLLIRGRQQQIGFREDGADRLLRLTAFHPGFLDHGSRLLWDGGRLGRRRLDGGRRCR